MTPMEALEILTGFIDAIYLDGVCHSDDELRLVDEAEDTLYKLIRELDRKII